VGYYIDTYRYYVELEHSKISISYIEFSKVLGKYTYFINELSDLNNS
jgi:hypothetical protein